MCYFAYEKAIILYFAGDSMTEQDGHIKGKFAASNDSSLFVPAKVNINSVSLGKIYVYENDPIPPTDADKVFGYDPVDFVNLSPDLIEPIKQAFIREHSKRYEEARKLLISTYEKYADSVASNLAVEMEGDADENIFVEVAMAQDSGISKEILAEIEKGRSAEAAVASMYQKRVNIFKSNQMNGHIAEQIEHQMTVLQHHLHTDRVFSSLRDAPAGAIIFCKNLPPAEVMGFIDRDTGQSRFAGLVCTDSSLRGHAAIIAKSLGIPFAVVDPAHLPTVKTGYDCIIDGGSGTGGVVLHPSTLLMREAVRQKTALDEVCEALRQKSESGRSVTTLDGQSYTISANFGSSFEVPSFKNANLEAIGLYRTEMAENMRTKSISEDHWYKIFEQNLRECAGSEGYVTAIIRTLDLAGDKGGRFAGKSDEEKAEYQKQVTRAQMAALARLNHDLEQKGHKGKVKVMIPMIANPGDMEDFQKEMDAIAAERNVPSVKLGCMGEVPALFDNLDKLDVAFMSIGSNDLIHFVLDEPRYKSGSNSKYDPTNRAVLVKLEQAVVFGREKDISISLCGDMASDPRHIALLVGVGITNVSCAINSAPVTREIISRIDAKEARHLVELLKDSTRPADRERILNDFNANRLGVFADGRLDMDWSEHTRRDFAPSSALPDREPGAPA